MNDKKSIKEFDEQCYETGVYNDNCDCELCEHKYECSGSNIDEEDE